MFPIVDFTKPDAILDYLETNKGVFIKDSYIASLGKEVLELSALSFNKNLPVLDKKTMFPTKLGSLPKAERQVIQRYINRPFNINNIELENKLKTLSKTTELLCKQLLSVAASRYRWTLSQVSDLTIQDEWALNVARYPFKDGEAGQMLFPAHKDWGMMAIYPYIQGQGLEVYLNGEWQECNVPEGYLFFYAGDIFTSVTNGKVPALLHRVRQPESTQDKSRTSIIFYVDPVREMILPSGQKVGDIIDSKLRKIGQIE